jgi:N utilization substance protein A
MNSVELISSFSDFARDKNIDKPTMISVLEEVFRTMIRKKFGSDERKEISKKY